MRGDCRVEGRAAGQRGRWKRCAPRGAEVGVGWGGTHHSVGCKSPTTQMPSAMPLAIAILLIAKQTIAEVLKVEVLRAHQYKGMWGCRMHSRLVVGRGVQMIQQGLEHGGE